jgi:hypothetical protein
MKQRAPALPDSATFQQLWDTLGSKLIEAAQEHLLYTQGVRGSSPLPPISTTLRRTPIVVLAEGSFQ